MRRFGHVLGVLWLVAACVVGSRAAPPAKWTVTLPDAGTYSLWVQAKTGTVSVLPTTVAQKPTVALPHAVAGDTLYVLDAHTGQVAVRLLSAVGPVALTVADFKPLTAPSVTPVASPAPQPLPTSTPPERPSNGIAQLFTWLLGLAVAVAVVWVLIRLVRTRGEPLIALARKAGVDVPDPKPLDPTADTQVMPSYEPPRPRTVEKIPEEAGAPPPIPIRLPAPGAGISPAPPLLGAGGAVSGTPRLVGVQGLAAGSTFTLDDGEVTVGRDSNNGIVLAETTVSRRHARLTRENGSVVLTDEGSANGVFVNGQRVQQATLVPGDQIQVGDNFFRFEA